MLNEDKIRLMTEIAMYEKREGKRIFPVNRFFRGDYVSSHMIRSFFAYTVSSMLVFLVWGLYNVERILSVLSVDEVVLAVANLGKLYLVGLFIYEAVVFVVYQRRYVYAQKGMKVYVTKLKRLEKRYEFQSKSKELAKEGGRRDGATRI